MSTITELQGPRPMEALQMRLPTNFQPSSATVHSRRNKIKLDPLRALEPARKKLSSIEAQRVMCCLEEAKKRCEIVSALPYIMNNIDKLSRNLGAELSTVLADHKKIYEQFLDLDQRHTEISLKIADNQEVAGQEVEEGVATPVKQPSPPTSRPQSRGISSRGSVRPRIQSAPRGSLSDQLEEITVQINMCELQIQISTKNMMRVMSLNPGEVTVLLNEVGNSKSREGQYFTGQLNDLREILMEKLLMTPVEEKEKMHYLSQVSAQERSNAVLIAKMEEELNGANQEKDHEIRLKNDVIRKLQNDLHMLEKATEEEIKRTKTEADKQEAADSKNSEGKRQKLQAEYSELKAKQQNLTTEHREEEQNLRRRKWKIETEVENWIQKYDADMGEKQDEYEEIDAVYTEEKKQLNELEERFKTLETEYKTITEARNKAKEERETAERELALMIKAATTIQAVWRSYKVRKALKQKNKKGKKGKKK